MAIPERPFGRLRERLHVDPSPIAWHHLCYTIYQHRDLWHSEEAAYYASGYLRHWPPTLRVAPDYWLRRAADEGVAPALGVALYLDLRLLVHSDRCDALVKHLAQAASAIAVPSAYLWRWPRQPIAGCTSGWSGHVEALTLETNPARSTLETFVTLGSAWPTLRELYIYGGGIGHIDIEAFEATFPALRRLEIDMQRAPSSGARAPVPAVSGLDGLEQSDFAARLEHLQINLRTP